MGRGSANGRIPFGKPTNTFGSYRGGRKGRKAREQVTGHRGLQNRPEAFSTASRQWHLSLHPRGWCRWGWTEGWLSLGNPFSTGAAFRQAGISPADSRSATPRSRPRSGSIFSCQRTNCNFQPLRAWFH